MRTLTVVLTAFSVCRYTRAAVVTVLPGPLLLLLPGLLSDPFPSPFLLPGSRSLLFPGLLLSPFPGLLPLLAFA
jgi:hypothetical protein